MKSLLKKIVSLFLKFPIPIKIIKFTEEVSQKFQGKGNGWGTGSIKHEVNNCLSLLKINPKIFIDIGANKGEYTSYLLKRKPNLECHIFEPSIENFKILKNKFNKKNIFVNQIGLLITNYKYFQ